MEKVKITADILEYLCFAVVDGQHAIISLHQHPDAAARFISASPRKDLSVAETSFTDEYAQSKGPTG